MSYATDKGADTARPEFTAPSADETLTFTLTVTGKGGITATDTVSVRVGAAGMRPMPKSAAVNGATLTLIYDEDLQTASPASATGKGPVYLAVVGGPGAQRSIETTRPTAVTASGRTVTMTLDPPAASNETVTLSYYPDNATADSRVRDTGGNLANGFAGFQVRNVTAEGPGVLSVAFAGAGKTYGIGDTVEIDVTFSEAVTVTGRPTLGLDVGGIPSKADYVSGSGSAVLRFEYTVDAGDLDSDGLAVKASGLETPSGSSIVTVAQAEAVILRHGSFSDPAHKVDGVLPTADAASVAGPTVTVTWSEALDEAAVPTGAGGFTVRIATADGPAVTAVAVSGSETVLSLASAIADGTQNVTLEYAPPDTGAKIRDAAGNDAAAIARADPLDVTVTPDTRAPEVLGTPTVDGATLAITFDEALDAASIPAAPGGFTVTVTRDSSAVSGHTVSDLSLSSSDTVLTLTLALAVRSGDLVTLAYAKPSTPLRDQAMTPNEVADFTTGSGDVLAVENRTPSVKTVAFAGAAQIYAIGGRVAVEVTFTQAVAVAIPTARPELSIEVGANTRKALYVSGTGSATLRFEYAIVAGDEDNDGISIPADSLSTPSGSSIVTVADSRTVQFGHDAVAADPAHKVDGVLPTADAAASAGPTVTVTWSEALDEAAVPTDAGGFTVRIATADGPAVTAVAVSGSETVLSLASAIADGTQNVTLEYAPPDTGAKIRDAAGNDAAAIARADPLDVTVTPDTRAPEVLGAPTVDGDALAVTFDEALDAASVPAAPGGFTVTVTRDSSAVSGHTVSALSLSSSDTVLTLTLALAVRSGDLVTLTYAKPLTPLRDQATTPNEVADFTTGSGDVLAVENRTPSVKTVAFAGAAQTYAIGGRVALEVTFTQAVAVATTPTARPELSIEVGANTRKALYVSGTGSATLRFEYAIIAGDEDNDGIAISADALSTPSGSSIVTVAGSRTVQFAHDAVAADPAHKVDGVLPAADAAASAGPTVTVTWSEALDEAAVPTGAGGFTVRIATADGPAVTAVAVSGSETVLSLASAIADGTQSVTLEYAPPDTGAKIRDAAGNDAAAIARADPLDVTVTPDTRAPEVLGTPTVDGATLAITFDEALDAASIPAAPGGFTVTVTRDSSAVSGHTVSALSLSSSDTVLTLTLALAVRGGDLVTLAYAKPSTPLRDQATTPNEVTNFTTGSGDVLAVENRTPSVKTVAFAGAAQTYAIGGRVAVEVTFTQAVSVAIPTARPELSIEVGANTRKALYVSGTGSATLRFEYAIVAGDEDNDGIAIPADSLSTPFGSSIVTVADSRTVQFGHDAVAADPAHKVDGVLPTADAAASAGPTVTVTWSEALDEAAVPTGAGGFTVRIATADGPAVTAVAVSGSETVLSLASAIADGTQSVTLEYAPPDTGAKIRDAVGNAAAAILRADPLDVTVTPDTRAPEVSGAPTVDGATLAVTFDEALDAASVPAAPGGFTVTVTRDSSAVSGHTVSALSLSSTGTVLTLTLAQGVLADDAVTLAYAKPSTPLRDQATTPNDVANFTTGTSSVLAVINGTGALELALSKATAVEGDDATITLTVAVEGSGTSGAARVIAVAASGTPTATQTGDWTLESGAGTLETGAKSVAFPITIIDDARLEDQETVTFAVTADGAAVGTVTLTIDDDDRAVLAVVGPGSHVTEDGEAFTIKLRLEPHPDNGPPVADDACFLDFPVTAILSVAGGASELTGTPTLPGEYTFAATASDCTREVTVDLETRASDGNWTGDRTVSFALARNSGQDARIDPGEGQVTVRDDTPPPGPLVEKVDMPAAPSGAAELTGPFRTRKAFYDRDEVPDDAVHGSERTAHLHADLRRTGDGRGW